MIQGRELSAAVEYREQPVGGGERASSRVDCVLEAVGYQYGYRIPGNNRIPAEVFEAVARPVVFFEDFLDKCYLSF